MAQTETFPRPIYFFLVDDVFEGAANFRIPLLFNDQINFYFGR